MHCRVPAHAAKLIKVLLARLTYERSRFPLPKTISYLQIDIIILQPYILKQENRASSFATFFNILTCMGGSLPIDICVLSTFLETSDKGIKPQGNPLIVNVFQHWTQHLRCWQIFHAVAVVQLRQEKYVKEII